jgi:transcriptional regulator with PAS, ATPase and Fis domain
VALNSTFSKELLESELFVTVKVLLQSCKRHKKGFIEEANGGTFFILDEIGEIS